jgi:NosR/NirI family transcriptional regulator, nitrous oxide reductase regulator
MTIQDEALTDGPVRDPLLVATRLRPPQRVDIEGHFAPTDVPAGGDLARHPRMARILKSRRFQFLLILPNQILFWAVIFIGLFGTLDPNLNFGTAITWYIWFCVVFVLIAAFGRAWCVMCPFGGVGEWVQRRTFWGRTQRALGLGIKLPEPIARYGALLSVGTFLLLTWLEEFFGIAGPGTPSLTSYMVIGIVLSALIIFLVFERRTFCRYICPLSCVVGSFGAMGSVAGFRTRDREVCLSCETKDCMRGGEDGYGCPWYTWPGSADSNLNCGLCSECYKACPSDNVGLFVQKPLTSVVAPTNRRADVGWAVAILFGLVLYQQVNALPIYTTLDDWLNTATHLPHYPNPVAYLGLTALFTALMAGIAWGCMRLFARPGLVVSGGGRAFLERASKFRAYFFPLMYGIIPVVGVDYLARQLPKFFQHAPALVPAVGHLFGAGSKDSPLYGAALLADPTIIKVQVAMMGVATLASVYTSVRIARRDLVPISAHARGIQIAAGSLAVACGVATGWLYVLMNAAA